MNQPEPDQPLENVPLQQIATQVFARHGVDFADARRAGGWTNATWIAGGLALRMSVQPGNRNLLNETQLGTLLPPETGYPAIIQTGITDGHAWVLMREVPGACLGENWDALTPPHRADALQQIWEKTSRVHQVELSAARPFARSRAWYNSNDPHEASEMLAHLQTDGLFTPAQAQELRAVLERHWRAVEGAPCVLNHGDLTLDNVMWHAGRVTALLDFEFAVIAPPEIDLNSLVKMAFKPDHSPAAPMDDPQKTVAKLAGAVLALPGAPQRLAGYAVLLETWLLQLWLDHPEGEGPLETWEPYRRLLSIAEGDGGHLAPLLSV